MTKKMTDKEIYDHVDKMFDEAIELGFGYLLLSKALGIMEEVGIDTKNIYLPVTGLSPKMKKDLRAKGLIHSIN